MKQMIHLNQYFWRVSVAFVCYFKNVFYLKQTITFLNFYLVFLLCISFMTSHTMRRTVSLTLRRMVGLRRTKHEKPLKDGWKNPSLTGCIYHIFVKVNFNLPSSRRYIPHTVRNIFVFVPISKNWVDTFSKTLGVQSFRICCSSEFFPLGRTILADINIDYKLTY